VRLAIVGAGWAGLSAAVDAVAAGHAVTLIEASRHLGGRARALPVRLPDGRTATLDNGQHIFVGAYRETLAVMRMVGVDPEQVLTRMPLTLRFPDGSGLALPNWPAPLDAAAGILGAKGWTARDKLSLLRAASRWRSDGFRCPSTTTVGDLCRALPATVVSGLIEPLCVAALNTPVHRASGEVFLRVLGDTLFEPGGSNLLLPRGDLGALFPDKAARWLRARGADIRLARPVQTLAAGAGGWVVDGERFERVLLACPTTDAARLVAPTGASQWADVARGLRHEAIATVYATGGSPLALPLLALRTQAQRPAQFVFDRAQLGAPGGVLAFVVSACTGDRETVQAEVIAQAHELGWSSVRPLQTVVEKRATFACTPGLRRPPPLVAPGLLACGDYVAGPYPATIEGAVTSARAAVAGLGTLT